MPPHFEKGSATYDGTAVSPASCCLIDTWSTIHDHGDAGNRSFTLTTGNGKGARYDASRTVSRRDLSWRPFSSTSTYLICQPPSPENMRMLTT